jgi:hypothetical protein
MGLGLVKKELQEAANDIWTSVKDIQARTRAFALNCMTRKLNFDLRHIPMQFNLPRLPKDITKDRVFPYLEGEDLARMLGTCRTIHRAVLSQPKLKERVELTGKCAHSEWSGDPIIVN